MNKVILMGRLTRDAEIRYSQGETTTAIARFSLAVDRRFNRNNDEQSADFINCVAFGRIAEFRKDLAKKEQNLFLKVVYRQVATPIKTDRKYIQQMLLLKILNLQKAKAQMKAMDLVELKNHHQHRLLEMDS